MACELPVVELKPVDSRVYFDGLTGFVVELTDKKTYVERVLKLLRDDEMSKVFGEAGRKSLWSFPESITDKFEEVYKKALATQ